MFIRYQTVRTVVIALAAAGAAVGLTLWATADKEPAAPVPVVASAPTTAPPVHTATPTPTTPTTAPSDPREAQMAEVAKVMLEQRASSDKIKDLFRGAGPKVNIYDDDKDGRWDRAKVDWNRDEVDDEKLNVKNGVLERKDEKTGEIKVFVAGQWTPKGR